MANGNNGTLWKIIMGMIGFIIVALGAMNALGVFQGELCTKVEHNTYDIQEVRDGLETYVWPEVEASKAHRTRDELNQTYMDRRFDKVERDIHDFTTEQRAVNQEILTKLNDGT